MKPDYAAASTFESGNRVDRQRWFMTGLKRTMAEKGLELLDSSTDEITRASRIVIHSVDSRRPTSYRRRSKSLFVVGLAALDVVPADVLKEGYTLMARSLSNVFMLLVHDEDGIIVYFITMERGFYHYRHMGDDAEFFEAVAQRLIPLATSRLVIDNVFETDLPKELYDGDEFTEAIYRAGVRLAELDLLPAVFPLEELLDPQDMRHLERLFGIGGLSYGNVSARRDDTTFWMSASGVDKSHLREVGREVLLVTGFDEEKQAICLSVPEKVKPRRVSVDAIEHYMLYREHPGVGAILHVHAWMEGIPSTEVNYPCGTIELAEEVAELVRAVDEPERAVIGLKNHGLTITGPNLDEIFERVEGQLLRQIPMS
jgi:ribulose-5-phosphate 4-epimerase/fuculose-1-phosphate aldolase